MQEFEVILLPYFLESQNSFLKKEENVCSYACCRYVQIYIYLEQFTVTTVKSLKPELGTFSISLFMVNPLNSSKKDL